MTTKAMGVATESEDSSEDVPFPQPLRIECFSLECDDHSPRATPKEAACKTSAWWTPARDCLVAYNPFRLMNGACANIRNQWRILALGQLLSFLNVANGAAQASLSLSCHLYAPLFTLGLVYFCLALGLVPIWWQRRNEPRLDTKENDKILERVPSTSFLSIESFMSNSTHGSHKSILEPAFQPDQSRNYSLLGIVPLSAPPLAYLPMATLDCFAQYFFLTSLRYTTLTSVTLLDSIAIPTAMLLSSLVLARKYRCAHYVGVFSCFIGIFMDVLQDYTADDETGTGGADLQDYPYKIRGDMLAMMGAVLFGCQEVLGEVAVRNLGGSNEYMAMLGFWASMVAFGQSYLSEKDQLLQFFFEHDQTYCAKEQAWILLIMYIISNTCYYHGVARFLQMSDAAFFNLSLLTGCVWSVLFGVLFLDRAPKGLFYFAVFFIVVGVITYEMASTPVVEDEEGHALENAKFRRWRKKAMRLRYKTKRRQGAIRLTKSDESVSDEASKNDSSTVTDDHGTHTEQASDGRVIV